MSGHDKGKFPRYSRQRPARPGQGFKRPAQSDASDRSKRRDEKPRRPPIETRLSATEGEWRRRKRELGGEAPVIPQTWTLTWDPEAMAMVEAFAQEQPYPLDPFQREAAQHLAEGRSTVVAAPTGTGKTVVAEFAIWMAQREGKRAIYTAPIKALSNQKFRDLRARYGSDAVGLLTGDIVENPSARIVVMTTEIYRNMLLEGLRAAHVTPQDEASELLGGIDARHARRTEQQAEAVAPSNVAEMARRARLDEELSSVGCVIFDELHFLNDPERGPVWEEAIIHSPPHVIFVGLSATVSNADELRQWIEQVHGPMALVYHTERAVPLEHFYFLDGQLRLAQNAEGQRVERFPGIGGETKLARMRERSRRYTFDGQSRMPASPERSGGGAFTSEANGAQQEETPPERPTPEPGEVLTALRTAELLPALYFLPGRRAVEQAAESAAAHLFTTPDQRDRLHREIQEWVRALPAEDQRLDQVRKLAALLPRGLGFHHAGLLPGLKVMVETLFQRGELKAVFATDTLALGINMPARSVVLGSLSKFDGTQMRLMTPNEYQQLTGRAGRRGIDAHGAAVIPYSPWDAFEPAFTALTAPLQPVTSAFTVRYNTVLNLWRPGDLARLRRAVADSLREFQRRRIEATLRRGRRQPTRQQRQEDVREGYEPRETGEERRSTAISRAALAELNATIYVLRALGYIGEDDALTVRGRMLRAIFHPAGVMICDLVFTGALDELSPAELAEVMSWFTFDSDRSLRNSLILPPKLMQTRRVAQRTQRFVQEFEYDEGLDMSPGIVDAFHSVALNWARGMSLSGLLRRIDLAEGDLLVTLNQTIDLLQQTQGALAQTLDARDVWRPVGPDARGRRQQDLDRMRARMEALRPRLGEAWRIMLRGSVAMSRAIPAMVTPALEPLDDDDAELGEEPLTGEPYDLPPLAMAEDEDPGEVAADLAEEAPDEVE
ncbi:MAG TPA: DEAD/DEAH box helicase [Ktedonobacterales bacterium]|jgi:superfamily II RNA helicase|nr:DEAD/DEAH box helicase [Ktedonobacterales bacterium]